jgi:hypothetical protein
MEKNHPEILVIGATSRNLGKTTLLCRLIQRFNQTPITAVKIKTLRDGDRAWHGSSAELDGNFRVWEDAGDDRLPDSGRMREAGARQVLYVKAKIEALEEAFGEALGRIPSGHLILVESNSLVRLINPGIYLLIKGMDPATYKPSARETESRADIIIRSDGKSFSTDPDDLPLAATPGGWMLTGKVETTSGS